jgi:hypothetical protein
VRYDRELRRVELRKKVMASWIAGRGKALKPGWLVTVVCLSLSAIAVVPLFTLSQSPDRSDGSRLWMPVTHDMILHFDQMKSFYQGLAAGEVYPRWEEDTNRGFGAPTTSYYPPGVYYLTSALYAILGDWIWTLLLAHFLMIAASGFAIYIYARRLMSAGAAIVSMTAYIFLPYHMFDQYQRGAIAELLGFALMPLMLMFAERLFGSKERSPQSSAAIGVEKDYDLVQELNTGSRLVLNTGGLALTLGAFLWSHPPTAYQFMISFTLFVGLLAWTLKSWKGLLVVSIAIGLGLLISAAYIYPAFVEQHLIHREFITNTWPYHSTYIFEGDSGYDIIEFMWLFNLGAIVIGAAALLFFEPGFVKPCEGLRERITLWLVVGCFACFMMTTASHFLVGLIPKIDIGVFAWRMLGITTLVAALMAGACTQAAINASRQQGRRGRNSLSSLASVAIVGASILVAVRMIASIYGAPPFATADEHVNLAMMPAAGPVEPLELPKVERARTASGEGTVEVESWEPEHRVLRVELSAADKLLIRTFNFPGWRATVDGEPVRITGGQALRVELANSDQALIRAASYDARSTPVVEGNHGRIIGNEPLGDIEIELQPGGRRVVLGYVDTPPRRLGSVVTCAGFLLVIGVILVTWVKGARRK